MTKRKTLVERLVDRLRQQGWKIPKKYKFVRCRPGHWQRAAGAYSWVLFWDLAHSIGSPDSVAACVKAKKLVVSRHGDLYAE